MMVFLSLSLKLKTACIYLMLSKYEPMAQEQAGIYIPTKDMPKHVEAPQNTKATKHY